jgi:hypothetical protein
MFKRVLINGFLLWIYTLIGWITIRTRIRPFDEQLANEILVFFALSLILTSCIYLAALLFTGATIATLGLGAIIFYPLYLGSIAFLFLFVTKLVVPSWVIINVGTLETVLMGVIIGLLNSLGFNDD